MDAELVDEFSAFVGASAHSLFRSALALTGHREQAEDLLQTVLARGVRHWSRIRDNNPEGPARPSGCSGATSTAIRRLRRASGRVGRLDSAHDAAHRAQT